MSLRQRIAQQQHGERFPEAVAQWRLTLRTEVKNSSALPTSVFHARDATLEAMLAASTEAMLARLQTPTATLAAPPTGAGAQRVEVVAAAELRALPDQLRLDDPATPRLDDHALAEALAALVDAALGPDAQAAQTAARLLRDRFAVGADGDPAAAAAHLRTCLMAGLAPDDAGGPAIDAVARAVVAAIAALPPAGAKAQP